MNKVELRALARYRLVDRVVVAESIGLGWWMLQAASSAGGHQHSWAVAPNGNIYQGSVEVIQDTNPACFRPLGPMTDLSADDLEMVGEGPFGEGDINRANRRSF